MSQTESSLFAILFTASTFTFGLSIRRLIRAIRLGRPVSG